MSHAMLARATLVLFGLSSGLAACKVKDPLYCDESTPCTDPALPFCDLNGEYAASEGIKRTCIAYPWDAGPDTDAGPACTRGEWTLDMVASDGNVGGSSAIAVDTAGIVHITYTDDDVNEVRYAYGGPGNWALEETTESGGYYMQMMIDEEDTVHVVYPGLPSGVRYLVRARGSSEFDGSLAANEEANDVALALTAEGAPTVCYSGMGGYAVCKVLTQDGWTSLPDPVLHGSGESVAIGPGDALHLSVDGISYKQWTGDEWLASEEVAAGADIYGVMTVDGDGAPHVIYREVSTGALRDAHRVGIDDWTAVTVDPSVDAISPAAVTSRGDTMYVVYAERSTSNLKYAIKRGSENWTRSTIDSTATIPLKPAVFVDARGGVHVAYLDRGDNDLRYAYLCP